MTTQPLQSMSQDEFFDIINRLVPMFEGREQVEKYMKLGVSFQLLGTNAEGRQVCNIRYAVNLLDEVNDYVFVTSAYFKESLPVDENICKRQLFELMMRKYDFKTKISEYLKESKQIRAQVSAPDIPLNRANELLTQCAGLNAQIMKTNEVLTRIQGRINDLCENFPEFRQYVDDEYISIDLI